MIVIPALMIRLGLGIARGAVSGSQAKNLEDFVNKFSWLIVSASTLGAVIDVGNTVALCILMEKNYNPMLRYLIPSYLQSVLKYLYAIIDQEKWETK